MNDMERQDGESGGGFARSLWALVTLRPYGDSMLTPAVRQWLAFSWAVVFLMSLIEGTVWGTVSRYFVPVSERGWLSLVLAPLFFVGVFAVIWIVDVSFVTSERPEAAAPGTAGEGRGRPGASVGERVRWWLGVLVRLAIVLISLAITAPFLTQAIRSDEVTESYRALVAQTRKAWEAGQVAQQDQALETLRTRQAELKSEQVQLDARNASQGVGAAAKTVDDLRAAAQEQAKELAAQLTGVEGRKPGYGPKAKAAEQAAKDARERLDKLTRDREASRGANDRRLREITEALGKIDADLVRATAEKAGIQGKLAGLTSAELAKQTAFAIPSDTIGVRAGLLAELRARDLEAEQERYLRRNPAGQFGWWQLIGFHFKTVEGLAQALLGILFLALIVLKAFEPKAVRLYFNETLQHQWRRYLDGVFDRVPGFRPSADADRHDHFEFAEVHGAFAAAPDAFWRKQESDHQARDALAALERERRYHDAMVQRRLQSADDQLEHERERLRITREDEQRALERQAAEALAQQHQAAEQRRLAHEGQKDEHERQRCLAEQDLAARQRLAARELEEKDLALQSEYRELIRRQGLETDAQRRRLEADLNARLDELERERQSDLRRRETEQSGQAAELAKAGELARLEIERVRTLLEHEQAQAAERLAMEQQAAAARLDSERERHAQALAQVARRSEEQASTARLEQDAREAELRGARERMQREHQDWERARQGADRTHERAKRAALIARATERIETLSARLAALDARIPELASAVREGETDLERASQEQVQGQAELDKLRRQIAAAETALDEEMGRGVQCRPAVRDEMTLRLDEYRRQEPIQRKQLAEIVTRAASLSRALEALGAEQGALMREHAQLLSALEQQRAERERAQDEQVEFL